MGLNTSPEDIPGVLFLPMISGSSQFVIITWYFWRTPSTSTAGTSSTVLPRIARAASAMVWICSGVTSFGTLMKNVCSSVVPLRRYVTSDPSATSIRSLSFSSSGSASSRRRLLNVMGMSM